MVNPRQNAPSGNKAYGYCRISLDRQDSVSVESQEQAIRAYHAQRLPELPLEIITDRGVSGGTRLYARPGGSRLKGLRPGDQLIVTKVDRAFRSLADGAACIEGLARSKVGVHCLDVSIDTTTPSGRAMLHMLLVFAQLERERIGERRRDAAAYRRSQGEPMHCIANPPMGWRVRGRGSARRYVADPADRRRCNRLRQLHDEGYGYRKIEMIAAREGWRTRRDTPWSKTQVRKAILASRAGFPREGVARTAMHLPAATKRRLKRSQYRRGEIRSENVLSIRRKQS